MAFSLKSSEVMVLRWGLRKDSVAWTRRVDGGAGEGLVGQGLQQLGDQAHLVGDDVVGHQAQLGLTAGEHAVLLVLDDGNRDVGALRAGAAGGGDGDDVHSRALRRGTA